MILFIFFLSENKQQSVEWFSTNIYYYPLEQNPCILMCMNDEQGIHYSINAKRLLWNAYVGWDLCYIHLGYQHMLNIEY